MPKLRYLLIACIATFAWVGMAQPRVLSVDQCVEMALGGGSLTLRQADNDVRQATEVRREAFTKYFPEISANFAAFRANKGMLQFGVLDILTVSLLQSGHMADVAFVQPLFMGGRIANGNRLAKVGETASRLRRDISRRDVALAVNKYYWEIAALKARQSTLNAAMQTVDSLIVTIQAAYDVGVVTLNDLLEARLKRGQFEADSIELAGGIVTMRLLLAQSIGADTVDIDIDFDGNAPFSVPELPVEDWRIADDAVRATPQYGLLDAGVRAAELEQKISLGSNMPVVAAGGGFFHTKWLDSSHGFFAGAITVSVPLTAWWGGSHAMRAKRLAAENARLRRQDDVQLLAISIDNAWRDVSTAVAKARVAHQSIAQAQENLHIYQAMYDAGTTTITDLLNAQTLQRQACDNYTQAYAAYRVNLAAYRIATNQYPGTY